LFGLVIVIVAISVLRFPRPDDGNSIRCMGSCLFLAIGNND